MQLPQNCGALWPSALSWDLRLQRTANLMVNYDFFIKVYRSGCHWICLLVNGSDTEEQWEFECKALAAKWEWESARLGKKSLFENMLNVFFAFCILLMLQIIVSKQSWAHTPGVTCIIQRITKMKEGFWILFLKLYHKKAALLFFTKRRAAYSVYIGCS